MLPWIVRVVGGVGGYLAGCFLGGGVRAAWVSLATGGYDASMDYGAGAFVMPFAIAGVVLGGLGAGRLFKRLRRRRRGVD